MRPIDIRKYKQDIRMSAREKRAVMDPQERAEKDHAIAANVRKLYQYRSAKTILIYVSTSIEVDTREIIETAWADGKNVAVPRCIAGTRQMEFHYIKSFDDVSPGSFSVLEPSASLPIVSDFSGCIMILPAITVDNEGFRLGYGKGYYDRYLARFNGFSAVLCYSSEVVRRLYRGRFDRPASAIVTEIKIKTCKRSASFERIGKQK